jgi:hypothetical protein
MKQFKNSLTENEIEKPTTSSTILIILIIVIAILSILNFFILFRKLNQFLNFYFKLQNYLGHIFACKVFVNERRNSDKNKSATFMQLNRNQSEMTALSAETN